MRTKLSLIQKGILFAVIPFVFESFFIAGLYYLLQRSELEAQRANHYKAVASATNQLVTDLYEGLSTLVTYHQTTNAGVAQHFSDTVVAIPGRVRDLKQLVADDQYQTKTLRELEPDLAKVLAFMSNLKTDIDQADPLSAFRKVSEWNGVIRLPFMRLMTHLHELAAYQDKNLKVDPQEEENLRQAFRLILALGIGGNLAIAIFVWKVTGSITRRVDVLTQNTVRLSSERELLPPQRGDDEISRLDRFFHKMAEALREAANRERAIVENAVDVIFSLDSSSRFTKVSKASATAWDIEPEELIGQKFEEVVAPAERKAAAACIERMMDGAKAEPFETEISKSDGTTLYALVSAQWVESERSLFCVAHDISARREVEKLKQEFVAMVSHDLRTPLTSVLSTLSLLGTGVFGQLNEKGVRNVDNSEKELSRMIQLINDLLDIARMEAGRMQFDYAATNTGAIIEASLNAVQVLAQVKNIEIICEGAGTSLIADADRLVQVLVNLLSNAVKFSPPGSRVHVSAVSSGDGTEFTVSDSGRGVPESERDAIFDRFRQVQKSDAQQHGGSGLGLAIAKSIVEGHGGTIGVRSRKGGGSIFWFKIPSKRPALR